MCVQPIKIICESTPITNIIYLSLKSGVSPDTLKLSHVTLLLKKPSLSKDDMNFFRLVSNLNIVCKLLLKKLQNVSPLSLSHFSRTTPLLDHCIGFRSSLESHLRYVIVTYKASANLKEKLEPLNGTRDLRSSDRNVLFAPRIKTKMGEGSF